MVLINLACPFKTLKCSSKRLMAEVGGHNPYVSCVLSYLALIDMERALKLAIKRRTEAVAIFLLHT